MSFVIKKYCSISNARVRINGREQFSYAGEDGYKKFIRAAYKHFNIDYPKFFKMDTLCKLGFAAIDILLQEEHISDRHAAGKTGIILCNASSSLEVDEKHQDTIKDREQYFPSPSNFVYTLPNIMAGEAAIKHIFRGENTVLITDHFDPELLQTIVEPVFASNTLSCCICGWVEQYKDNYEAVLFLVEDDEATEGGLKSAEDVIFEASNMMRIYKQEQK